MLAYSVEVFWEKSDSSHTEADEPTILRRHAFERPLRGEFEKLQIRGEMNGGLCVVALAVTVLVIVGCILPSIVRGKCSASLESLWSLSRTSKKP